MDRSLLDEPTGRPPRPRRRRRFGLRHSWQTTHRGRCHYCTWYRTERDRDNALHSAGANKLHFPDYTIETVER